MKALTVKQPYASLIVNNIKTYEFRTWKTNYRGKILIHAGLNKENIEGIEKYNLEYIKGAIIGEAYIKDCILVDEMLDKSLRKENNIIYKNNHVGEYAWVLENIKKYDNPIYIKGSLSLWDYKTEKEIMDIMNEIEYGYIYDGKNQGEDFSDFNKKYKLESPKEVLKNKLGICWSQVELERYLFKNYNFKTYFICYNDADTCPSHTFLVYKKENKYYWFEHSWYKHKGIHEFNSLNDLLKDVIIKFMKDKEDETRILLFEYKKPKYNITVDEFFKHISCSKEIDINSL